MSSKSVNDIKSMFSSAVTEGDLSQNAANVMINSLDGTNLDGCIGTSIDDLDETDDITVVSIILDSSASMSQFQSVVRLSYDTLINSLKESKQHGSMLVSTRHFATTQTLLHGFKKVDEIGPIGNDYIADGGSTALYDTLVDALTGIKIYTKTLMDSGIRVKSIVVVLSDGDDNDSHKNRDPKNVRVISEDLLKSEQFYLCYVGYDASVNPNDPNADDLLKKSAKKIADKVGFPNVLGAAATEKEIRRTVGLVSKSIIRTSQTQIGATNSFFS